MNWCPGLPPLPTLELPEAHTDDTVSICLIAPGEMSSLAEIMTLEEYSHFKGK